MNFKIGDYATVQGQVVKILDFRQNRSNSKWRVKVQLTKARIANWLNLEQLQPLDNQITPKVLFNKKLA